MPVSTASRRLGPGAHTRRTHDAHRSRHTRGRFESSTHGDATSQSESRDQSGDAGAILTAQRQARSRAATTSARIRFAHPSEREFAKILDFYRIRWLYEPHTFPLVWADDGRVTESFTPDFYLPDLDMFIELTTLKQSLVTKKNRKLRRLRGLYPGLNIKIFYGRDYRMLAFKYGMDPNQKR